MANQSKKKKQDPQSKWEQIAAEEALDETEASPEVAASEATDVPSEEASLDFPSRTQLEDQLTATEMQLEEMKSNMLLARAESENIRRRAEREVSQAHKFGSEKILQDLLPVLDAMTRGLEGPEPTDPALLSMREGIKLSLEMLEKTLGRHGVQPIDPAPGEAFNPELHEAMATQESADHPANSVFQALQKGYQLNGRVLRQLPSNVVELADHCVNQPLDLF